MRSIKFLWLMVLLFPLTYTQAQPPQNDGYTFELISDEFESPVYVTHAGDERLFVVEKLGTIRIVADGVVLPDPFLDIGEKLIADHNEQGLLGLAFAPDYAESGIFYVFYTDLEEATVVERYHVSADDPDRADASSGELILQQSQPYPNHNGGQILFGQDGYLYIGLGDGGSADDPFNNAQNVTRWLGKILRIDVSTTPYSVPPDNPYLANSNVRPEILMYGLRNPWRFSFDRATGDLYIADVGQDRIEEVNYLPADQLLSGHNFGWDIYEGSRHQSTRDVTQTPPIFEYEHREGNCSVTGGYVYRGAALPDLQGQYFYGDFCSGRIWMAALGSSTPVEFMDTDFLITSFGEDVNGELYIASYGSSVWKLVAR